MSRFRPFRILLVCTGNVCRSPFVERVLQSRLEMTSPGAFEIRSAGTNALVGQGMTREIADIVSNHGASDAEFVSRQLTDQVLADQDLVLAMTREHRAKVLEVAPRLLRRAFTLREFGRMAGFVKTDLSPNFEFPAEAYDRWNYLISMAASIRHEVLGEPEEDDVIDPYRRDSSVHREMVMQVMPALDVLAEFEASVTRA